MLNIKFSVSLVVILFSVGLVMPRMGQAVILYLVPSEGNYSQGETFVEEIRLDTEGEDINTVKVDLNYPKDTLEIVDFSDGGSILRLWVERPTTNHQQTTDNKQQGIISFTGGIPNGFNGEGLVGKIIFRVHETGTKQERETDAKLEFLEGTQVLLNDGFGTPAKLTTKGAFLRVLAKEVKVPQDKWQEEIEKDNIPPEPFEIQINKDPLIFEGKYFITFLTYDKQSGIDYYEVKEGEGEWQKATSPYLLQDQSLKSIILVKAIDKAGNERIEMIKPAREQYLYLIIGISFLVIGWIIYKITKTKTLKITK